MDSSRHTGEYTPVYRAATGAIILGIPSLRNEVPRYLEEQTVVVILRPTLCETVIIMVH